MTAKTKVLNFHDLIAICNEMQGANHATTLAHDKAKGKRTITQVLNLLLLCRIERALLRSLRRILGARANYLTHSIDTLKTRRAVLLVRRDEKKLSTQVAANDVGMVLNDGHFSRSDIIRY